MANIELLFVGFINGALQMTRRLRMSVSQKLASWKGSAEDAKAEKNKIRVNPRNPRLNISSCSSW
jgi:hypothetical protein